MGNCTVKFVFPFFGAVIPCCTLLEVKIGIPYKYHRRAYDGFYTWVETETTDLGKSSLVGCHQT